MLASALVVAILQSGEVVVQSAEVVDPCRRMPVAMCRAVGVAIAELEHADDDVCQIMGHLARRAFLEGEVVFDDTSARARAQLTAAVRRSRFSPAATRPTEQLIILNPSVLLLHPPLTRSLPNVLAHESYHLFVDVDRDGDDDLPDRPGPAYEVGDRCQGGSRAE